MIFNAYLLNQYLQNHYSPISLCCIIGSARNKSVSINKNYQDFFGFS
ncbi:hypothetical protein VL20_5032 [Microcystis panniformis FACHB-1757]|uniref:Uncharacterized protein n=1 Tax=Microcystis panniformis FACHB-1757 TaxID=1638788 RepID=A0A0K1S778_9CHRO|nr:hypothetical protein VL20_5032 [Microcystis panniformis FACHB-1757]